LGIRGSNTGLTFAIYCCIRVTFTLGSALDVRSECEPICLAGIKAYVASKYCV